MLLLILDSLGTSELLVILVVALIFFGPRKLPQISRQIGKGLAEFRKASEDFKRTWEREVALENTQTEANVERSMLPPETSIGDMTVERGQIRGEGEVKAVPQERDASPYQSVTDSVDSPSNSDVTATRESTVSEPPPKSDWF
jgi:Tat protein translocase TatB subunit